MLPVMTALCSLSGDNKLKRRAQRADQGSGGKRAHGCKVTGLNPATYRVSVFLPKYVDLHSEHVSAKEGSGTQSRTEILV